MTNSPATKPEKAEKSVPDYAHTVVVPIANPKTAPELLNLALAVVQRDGGRVIALAVTLSDRDAEENRDRLDTLEELVEEKKPRPKPLAEPLDDIDVTDELPSPPEKRPPIALEFVTRTAMNIARGILDQARESGAELIILGVQRSVHEEVVLGPIAQSVMSAAPCDVLVYRYSDSPQFNRITIPVDGSPASRMAVRMGVIFANAQKGCPVEAIHVHSSDEPAFQGRARIEQTLDGVPGRGIVKQILVNAHDPSAAILSRVDENHLIIMGFSRRGEFERWLYGESKNLRNVLGKAPGPVLIAVRSTEVVTARQRQFRRLMSWLRPQLTDIEQEQIIWDANSNSGIDLDYVVLMVVAAMLASLGLLLNSVAVIIGAMLVAPLMSPLTAFGIGLSTARLTLTRRSLVTALTGVAIASLVGLVMGLIIPLESPTDEMMSRVSPTLLDAFVALASGVVGSYATARKDIPAALAGVAIAAALVPPICTFGLQLAFGEYRWAFGAMLLFVTNMICIIIIAAIVFAWMGLHPDTQSMRRRSYVSLVIFTILALPAVLVVLVTLQQAGEERAIEQEISRLFTPVQVMSVETTDQGPLLVTTTLRTPYIITQEAVAAAETYLSSAFGQDVRLQLVVEQLVLTTEAQAIWIERYSQDPVEEAPITIQDGQILPLPSETETTP